MIRDMKAASALAAKTARACDSCLRRRARWFCAADDAFLCHGCDSLVHSANQLANRHERVKLQSASNKVTTTAQTWHSGFTRKARTPRNNNNNNKHLALQQRLKHKVFFNNNTNVLPVVPELGGEEEHVFDDEESEEKMLCCVPVLEPFDDAELCHIYNNGLSMETNAADKEACDLDNFSEFLASDMDLSEFVADVESLLGSSEQVFDCKEEYEIDGKRVKGANAIMKVKDEGLDEDTACHFESVFSMTNEAFDWNIDSVLSTAPISPPQEEKVVVSMAVAPESKIETKSEIILRLKLNYEEVITAWASQGSPWTTENPPQFNFEECWPDFLDSSSGGDVQFSSYGEVRSLRGNLVDEGREARVSRYREKRRTRLFAKKIRYEVRKLNAEKRPRMKGRFVKRTCFVAGSNNDFQPYH